LPDHFQIFESREMRINVRFFRDVAETPPVGDSMALDRLTVKQDLAGTGLDQSGDHFQSGGFAGAIGPQISGYLTGACDEADILYGGDAGVEFGDVAQFEHRI
jgi:hypothetical protein